jgi:hypothetical protein
MPDGDWFTHQRRLTAPMGHGILSSLFGRAQWGADTLDKSARFIAPASEARGVLILRIREAVGVWRIWWRHHQLCPGDRQAV